MQYMVIRLACRKGEYSIFSKPTINDNGDWIDAFNTNGVEGHNFDAYMTRTLNAFGREGWKPIHITPLQDIGGVSAIDTKCIILITFAKE